MTRVKICGITSPADAVAAWHAGADAIGMIFAPSPRRVAVEAARRIAASVPPWVLKVGVFVDEDEDTVRETVSRAGLQAVQFHGGEPAAVCARFLPSCIKVIRPRCEADLAAMEGFPAGAFLLDTWSPDRRGGTGRTFDWSLARQAVAGGRPVILSGGLHPDNVAEAIRAVGPAMVDVSSGVESETGRKDPEKMRAFVRNAKGAVYPGREL